MIKQLYHHCSLFRMQKHNMVFVFVTLLQFLLLHSELLAQQTVDPVKIPQAVKLSREGRQVLPSYEPVIRLDTLLEGDDEEVFPAPPCLDGEYYVGFQLFYDLLADRNTVEQWVTSLEVAFIHGEDTLWRRPLQTDMTTQTFIATIFHDSLISCDGDYHFYVQQKDSTGNAPWENTYLKILLYKNHDDVFDPAATLELDCNYANGQTFIGLNYAGEGALAYDLEWVFIANHENFTGSTQQAFQFKEPVRITTANAYYIHRTYYPAGRIWYRARAVGYNPQYPEHRIPGHWFYSPCAAITINNHAPGINWQEQTVFAEEGKYKKIMHYFDGSLRKRQSLTNLNTEGVTLVADMLYDYEGRKSVDILAVPATDASLNYKAGFNVFQASDPMVSSRTSTIRNKFHYDNHRLENSIVSDVSGAGNYYSPATNHYGNFQDFVPNGEGYVYSQTEYLRDGTGRVARQSGVGKAFKIDGQHATRYHYAEPTKEELIRLFGTNVGNASHYKKNLVIDPNGQVSVSYLDQEGRVIATALAGEKPANVDGLDSYVTLPSDPLTVNIIDKNTKDGNISKTTHKIANVGPTRYTFRYDLAALASEVETFGCKSCSFDLSITLTDPEGARLDLSAFAGNQSADGLGYERKGITAASCQDSTQVNDIVIDTVLTEIGDYTITKVLTAHDMSFEEMKTLMQQDSAVQAQIQQLEDGYVIDPADCEICTSNCPEADSLINETISEIATLDCENILNQILAELRNADDPDDEPTQAEISQHPLYCKYQLCMRNRESDVFDKQLARLSGWNAAVTAYPSVLNADPFFNIDSLSGFGSKLSMISRLSNVVIGTIGYDSNGDGVQDGSRTYEGQIGDVTDPTNTDYFVNANGVHTPNGGKHILYLDLLGKKGQMTTEAFNAELDRQRWMMYRGFHIEAKRKTKLATSDYQGCAAAREELEVQDEMNEKESEEEIIEWGNQNGVVDTVSNEEVEMSIATIRNACNVPFSQADSIAIAGHLKAYFNGNPKNFLRLIFISDLNSNPHLVSIQDILDNYNCSLTSVAVVDPLDCVRDTTVAISIGLPIPPPQPIAPLMAATDDNNNENETDLRSASTLSTKEEARLAEDNNDEKRSKLEATIDKRLDKKYAARRNGTSSLKNAGEKALARSASASSTVSTLDVVLPSPEEYHALMELYAQTGGPSWKNNTGWATADPDSIQDVTGWYGVITYSDGHVGILNLSNNGLVLQDHLPAEIGDLAYLIELDLSRNNLPDTIPSTIGNLILLRELVLNNSKLKGPIPEEIENLTNLEYLQLEQNSLNGPIPDGIGNFSNLWYLNLRANNNLGGQIPASLGSLSNLEVMNISVSDLEGPIPAELGNLSNLQSLDIHGNNLSGNIPSSLGNLVNLTDMYLSFNQLTGSIPSSFGKLTSLEYLSLEDNLLEGSLPDSLGYLPNIQSIYLYGNKLTGTFPSSFANLSTIGELDVYDNKMSGDIPAQLGSLPNLYYFAIGVNKFTFSNFLGLKSNYSGTFHYNPQDSVDVKQLITIEVGDPLVLTASIDRNTTPASRYQWFKFIDGVNDLALTTMDAANHTYTVPVSSESNSGWYYYKITNTSASQLTLTSRLQQINVTPGCQPNLTAEYNALVQLFNDTNGSEWTNQSGWAQANPANVSTWYGITTNAEGYVISIDLENNNLSGVLPVDLSKLCYLEDLYLSDNELSGSFPAAIADLKELEHLSLRNNNFTGEIPPSSFGSTTYSLDLSNNDFSGDLLAAFGGHFTFGLEIGDNKFTFTDILGALRKLCSESEPTFSYAPQDSVDILRTITVTEGGTVTLTTDVDRNSLNPSLYQWFKNGVALTQTPQPSTTAHTISIPNVSDSDAGDYYVQITNDDYSLDCNNTGGPLTLIGRLQTVIVEEDTTRKTYDLCLEYDTANVTLKKFSFKINWNKEFEECMADLAKGDSLLIEYAVEKLLEGQVTNFYNQYRTQCFKNITENLAYTYVPKEYHYTLYYYDQAANLVQTVPPKGVKPLSPGQVISFIAGDHTDPAHELFTRYQYNSLNQLLWQKTPDAGESRFWYNEKGQLKLSQNAQQYLDSLYSYTKYDEQGRIIEVGEMAADSLPIALTDSLNTLQFPVASAYVLTDITRTHYDFGKPGIQSQFIQQYLRTRVSWVEVIEKNRPDTISTYYTYDIHGNVKALLQELPGLEAKRTDYVYDLVTGKVNYVLFQFGETDQFIHHYSYDADNRITDVRTSSDGFIWDKDASYHYYKHGMLGRVELGEYRVQGQDYYYTLQGWIKGVNVPFADDPDIGNLYDFGVGKDVYSYALGYYEGDYQPVNADFTTPDQRDHLWARLNENNDHSGLYNGNISWMVTDLARIGEINNDRTKGMQAMLYQYDQLNRIVRSRSLTAYAEGTGFAARTASPAPYDEDYKYDPNGNILTLQRMNEHGTLMDDFNYQYYVGTNRLREVIPVTKNKIYSKGPITTDNIVYRNITITGTAYVPEGSNVEVKALEDILMEPDFGAPDGSDFWAHIVTDEGTYQYDAIGNLILDQDEGVQITWTPYGKVRDVHTKGDSIVVSFRYDGTGNRVEKKVVRRDSVNVTSITRYVRDAGGNVMAVYNDTLMIEQPIYGGDRVGQYIGGREDGKVTLGQRRFELSNHLGNVLAIVTDNIGVEGDSTWVTASSATDYYPFGLEMKGRTYRDTTSSYRYGFNGKEKDGNGEWGNVVYDYGFRIYNPAIAKFLSVDPLTKSYPMLTPYQFASNTPIQAIDQDGLEAFFVQGGIRVSVPFVPSGLGITVSVNAGIAFDLDGNIGFYSTPSGGVQNGIGLAAGLSAGINFEADNINDLSGWGINTGIFLGGEGLPLELSGELNWAIEGKSNNLIELLMDPNTEYNFGANVGLPIPNTGFTIGGSLYGEIGYTTFHGQMNILEKIKEHGIDKVVQDIITEFESVVESFSGNTLEDLGYNKKDLQQKINSVLIIIKQVYTEQQKSAEHAKPSPPKEEVNEEKKKSTSTSKKGKSK